MHSVKDPDTISVASPKAAVLSPTAIQVSQPLVSETEDARSPAAEKEAEADEKATSSRDLNTPEETSPDCVSPVASPVRTPLSQALSHLSNISVSQRVGSMVSAASLRARDKPDKHAINEADLIAYSDYQASKLSYPNGCPVWYTFANESVPGSVLSDVRYGTVKAAAMNVVTRSFVYRIEKESGDPGDDLDLVLEDHIAYATSCPVRVTVEGRAVDGEIICPTNLKDFTGLTTYSVMLKTGGNKLKIEHNVPSEKIKFKVGEEMEGIMVAQAVSEDRGCNSFACW